MLSRSPCHRFKSSLRNSLTRRCCLTMFNPLNLSEVMSIAYMLPHPPEMLANWHLQQANVILSEELYTHQKYHLLGEQLAQILAPVADATRVPFHCNLDRAADAKIWASP